MTLLCISEEIVQKVRITAGLIEIISQNTSDIYSSKTRYQPNLPDLRLKCTVGKHTDVFAIKLNKIDGPNALSDE